MADEPQIAGPSPDDAQPVNVAVFDDCIIIVSRRRLDIVAQRTVVPFALLDLVFQQRLAKLIQAGGVTLQAVARTAS